MNTTPSTFEARLEGICLRDLLHRSLGEFSASDMPAGPAISDICLDSRRVRPGSAFVAIPGAKLDGAAFVSDAVARGAAVVIAEPAVVVPAPALAVRVSDPRTAAARLAAVFYGLDRIQNCGELRMVGVTGTNGKSTTAFMVRSLLASAGHPCALLGTIEYDLVARKLGADLTTPDPVGLASHLVEAWSAGARHGVMEVSSHSLDQRRTDGIVFDVGIFTNLTQDHLDYHQTLERYGEAKRRLFESLGTGATAVVNADDPVSDRLVAGCRARVIRYGLRDGVDVQAVVLCEDIGGTAFELRVEGRTIPAETVLPGRYNVANALAAACAGLALGLDEGAIQRGLANLRYVPGRLQRVDTDGLGFDVFVDYAHTDDALRNVLGAARPLTRGRLWCVFGCGGDRDRTKRPKMARAVAEIADSFVVTSDNPRTEDPLAIIADIEAGLESVDRSRYVTEPNRAEAIGLAIDRLREGDTLIIAGKGHEDYQILGTTKVHFDDGEVAAAAIARRRKGAT